MNQITLSSSIALKVGVLLFILNLWGCSHSIDHQFTSIKRDVPVVMGHNPIATEDEESFSPRTSSEYEAKPSSPSHPVTKPHSSYDSREKSRVESVLERIAFKNHLYLAKDGSLIGDFTLHNQNRIPVSNISVECAELSPQLEVLRTSSRALNLFGSLEPDEEQRFEQVDFGYVEHDFDTVNCRLHSVKVY